MWVRWLCSCPQGSITEWAKRTLSFPPLSFPPIPACHRAQSLSDRCDSDISYTWDGWVERDLKDPLVLPQGCHPLDQVASWDGNST